MGGAIPATHREIMMQHALRNSSPKQYEKGVERERGREGEKERERERGSEEKRERGREEERERGREGEVPGNASAASALVTIRFRRFASLRLRSSGGGCL